MSKLEKTPSGQPTSSPQRRWILNQAAFQSEGFSRCASMASRIVLAKAVSGGIAASACSTTAPTSEEMKARAYIVAT